MDAGIYNRVSSAHQIENFSLDEQSRVNREYAARNGMTVIKEVTVDESASDLFRSGLDEMLQLIERREIQALIVYGSDRLSRSTVDGLLLLEALAKSNVELHYASRGKVENTPEHRILHAVEFSMNEYWKFKMQQAMKRGRDGKLKEGFFIGNGPVPYGYRRIGTKRDIQLVIDEEEAEVIRQIFSWYVVEDWGIFQIGRELDARGILTFAAKHQGKTNVVWTPGIVRLTLKKRVYMGEMLYNYQKREEYYDAELKKRRTKTRRVYDDAVVIPVPAIVDRGIWERAQEKLANSVNHRREGKGDRQFLLQNRIRCGLCDHAVSPKSTIHKEGGKVYEYYFCSNQNDHRGMLCKLPMFRAPVVDALAWEYIRDLLLRPEKIAEGLRRSKDQAHTTNDRVRKLIAETDALIRKQEEALVNILTVRVASTSSVADTALQRMQQDTEKLLEELQERQKGLTATLIPEVDIEATLAGVQAFREQVTEDIQIADSEFPLRRKIVAYLQVKAILTVEDGEKVLYLTCVLDPGGERFPVDPMSFSESGANTRTILSGRRR